MNPDRARPRPESVPDPHLEQCNYNWTVGSSDFTRSLCFMWFWFGLEILRLVYKKAFNKILNAFYLIWPFNFKKIAPSLYKSWKKFLQNWMQRYQNKQNFALISKMCRTLASFFKFLKNQFICKFFSLLLCLRLLHIFEIGAKFVTTAIWHA